MRARLVSTLTDALEHTPAARWMLPRACSRAASLRRLVASTVDRADREGVIVADEEGRGASVWLREDGVAIRHTGRYVERVRTLAAAGRADPRPLLRGRRYDQSAEPMLARARRELGEHWRLALLGVDPRMRGSALGSNLLARGLRAADAAGVSTLVLTHQLREADFFGRFGYRVREDAGVAGGGLRIALLWRPNPLGSPSAAADMRPPFAGG